MSTKKHTTKTKAAATNQLSTTDQALAELAYEKAAPIEVPGPRSVKISLMGEQGTTGLKEFGGWVHEAYIPKLQWPQAGEEYSRLRTSTPAIVMTAHQFVSWARTIKPVVNLPEKPTDDDKRYKDFRESDFDNMEGGFSKYIETAVGRVPFDGFYDWSIVLGRRDPNWVPPPYIDNRGQKWEDDWRSDADDGLIGVRRLAARDNSAFWRWDLNGAQRMIGLFQRDPKTGVEYRLDKSELLHHTFGDPHNPEGNAGLQPCYRLERLQYGLQVIYGIGAEHTAGYLSVQKTEKGELTTKDESLIAQAVKYILTAQEGNVAIWPYGFDTKLIEASFTSAPGLLEAMQHFDIMMLSVFGMQWMALNTLTRGGAKAAQADSTDSGITSFNSMTDGLASQWDDQVERKIYNLNKDEFPNMTKRPKVTFSNLENVVPLTEISSFFSQMVGKFPFSEDDLKAIRRITGFLPQNNPDPKDVVDANGQKAGDQPAPKPAPAPQPRLDPNQTRTDQIPPDVQAQAGNARNMIQQALSYVSRRKR